MDEPSYKPGGLRPLGGYLVAIGATLGTIGFADLLLAVFGSGSPTKMWCLFVGVPVLVVGISCLKDKFVWPISKLFSGESDSVPTESVKYVVEELRPSLHVASEDVRGGEGQDTYPPRRNLTACPTCGRDVAVSQHKCPHCGEDFGTPAKTLLAEAVDVDGCLKKILRLAVLVIIAIVIANILIPILRKYEKGQKLNDFKVKRNEMEEISNSDSSVVVSKLSPHGELARMYKLGSQHTDLQRDEKTAAIIGRIVQWDLTVYEVRKLSDDQFRIQTSGHDEVDTFITLTIKSQAERDQVRAFLTGSTISISGKIKDVTMRHIEIEPAVLK